MPTQHEVGDLPVTKRGGGGEGITQAHKKCKLPALLLTANELQKPPQETPPPSFRPTPSGQRHDPTAPSAGSLSYVTVACSDLSSHLTAFPDPYFWHTLLASSLLP